tara:strand:- start:1221 stop:3542 length:2322 start_codon:yes stop_codon:yes gene_type:complete
MAYINKQNGKKYQAGGEVTDAIASLWEDFLSKLLVDGLNLDLTDLGLGGGTAGDEGSTGSNKDKTGGIESMINLPDQQGSTYQPLSQGGLKRRSFTEGGENLQDADPVHGWDLANNPWWDFSGDPNIQGVPSGQRSKTTGRPKQFASGWLSPQTSQFTTEGMDTQASDVYSQLMPSTKVNKKGQQQFLQHQHGSPISQDLMDLSEDQMKDLMSLSKSWTESSRELTKKVPGESEMDNFLRSEIKGKRSRKNYGPGGFYSDLNELQGILGKDVDPNQAELMMHQLRNSQRYQDAIMAKFPNLDPGTQGGAYHRRKASGDMQGQFPNAPLSYQENFKASVEAGGLDDRYPVPKSWLNVQNIAQGVNDNIPSIISSLSEDNNLLSEMGKGRQNFKDLDLVDFQGVKGQQVFMDGVRQGKDGQWYSKQLQRPLTTMEENVMKKHLSGVYLEDSGWKSGMDVGAEVPSKKTITEVKEPVSGIDMAKPTPLGFTDDTGDVDLEEVTGGVQVGPITGGYEVTEDTGERDDARKDRSINAVLESWKNRTHVKTGEGYGQGDLDRDSEIIKSEFGDDAYNDLVSQLGAGGEDPVSTDTATTEGGGNRRRGKGFQIERLYEASKDKEEVANVRDDDEELEEEDDNLIPGTLGYQQKYGIMSPFSGMVEGTGIEEPISTASALADIYKTGGRINKYPNGGKIKTNRPRIYQSGGKSFSFDVPQFYKKGDSDMMAGYNQYKQEVEAFKAKMDPNNSSHVRKLEMMEDKLAKMNPASVIKDMFKKD